MHTNLKARKPELNGRNYEVRATTEPLTLMGTAIIFNEPVKIGNISNLAPDALCGVDLSEWYFSRTMTAVKYRLPERRRQ
jgi:hypothetical protein